jgi:hypothetical protein
MTERSQSAYINSLSLSLYIYIYIYYIIFFLGNVELERFNNKSS